MTRKVDKVLIELLEEELLALALKVLAWRILLDTSTLAGHVGAADKIRTYAMQYIRLKNACATVKRNRSKAGLSRIVDALCGILRLASHDDLERPYKVMKTCTVCDNATIEELRGACVEWEGDANNLYSMDGNAKQKRILLGVVRDMEMSNTEEDDDASSAKRKRNEPPDGKQKERCVQPLEQ